MRAACYYGPGDVRIEELPEPSPGPGEVKVKVLANGLCGTDLHQYYVGPMSDASLPIVVGHEFAGEIVEAGEGVQKSRIGELVAIEPIWRCNSCAQCKDGDYNLCRQGHWHGLTGKGGGLAEFTVVRDEMAWAVPDGVAPSDAALVEPLAVAFHAVERAQPRRQDRVIVLGAGPIGIGVFLGLRAEGVEDVIVVEPAAERQASARAVGAPQVIDPAGGGAAEEILAITRGTGSPLVIDAAGTAGSFADALAVLSPKGRIILVAAYTEPVSFNPTVLLQREARIDLSFAYRGTFEPVLNHMAAGRYPTEPWVSHVPLDELTHAYERLHQREAVKLLVDI
jgi:(R,R)-butanediol dehydrogenase / meso-butanediol dehydrogenase / diacetyl reductase